MSMSKYPCFKHLLSSKLVSITVTPSVDLSCDKIQNNYIRAVIHHLHKIVCIHNHPLFVFLVSIYLVGVKLPRTIIYWFLFLDKHL